MQNLIIHTATRICHVVTTTQNPTILTNQSLISVPDSFDLANPIWKLALDNITLLRPTQAEIDAMNDDYDPGRNEVRELKSAGTTLFQSAQTLGNSTGILNNAQVRQMASDLKTFMVKLNNWVKAPQ